MHVWRGLRVGVRVNHWEAPSPTHNTVRDNLTKGNVDHLVHADEVVPFLRVGRADRSNGPRSLAVSEHVDQV